jgi:hypothetical protein
MRLRDRTMRVRRFLRKTSNGKTILFLHIPKCAGTTLVEEILKMRFSPEEILIFYEQGTEVLINRLKDMSKRKQRRLKCVAGHFAFGIHKHYTGRPCAYITILRDPVDRVISHYNDVVRRKSHYLHDQVKTRNLSLKQYVESGISLELNNGQTRILAGIGEGTPFGVSYPRLLDLAQEHLDMCEIVGVSEDFSAFLGRLEKQWGWDIPEYSNRNISSGQKYSKDIDNETRRVIENFNDLDIELYRFARDLLQEREKDRKEV